MQKKENPLMNLLLNIVIPSVILIKFSSNDYLGPVNGLITAISFPLGYGLFSLIKNKKVNYISIIGLISVLLTGVFGVLKLDAEWIAYKEAGVPLIIGLAVLISLKTPFPLVKKLLYNDQVLNTQKINATLQVNNNQQRFEKRLVISTFLLACTFFLSSGLNFILAKIMLISEPGTEAFNTELGKMTAYSFPIIAIPSMIFMVGVLYYLIRSITLLTGLKFTEIFTVEIK
mgnify:FL=1